VGNGDNAKRWFNSALNALYGAACQLETFSSPGPANRENIMQYCIRSLSLFSLVENRKWLFSALVSKKSG
jgi:hypothetical protein